MSDSFERVAPGPRSWFKYRGRLWTGSTGVMIRHDSIVPPVVNDLWYVGWSTTKPSQMVDDLLDAWEQSSEDFIPEMRTDYPIEYLDLIGQGALMVCKDQQDGLSLLIRNTQPIAVLSLIDIKGAIKRYSDEIAYIKSLDS